MMPSGVRLRREWAHPGNRVNEKSGVEARLPGLQVNMAQQRSLLPIVKQPRMGKPRSSCIDKEARADRHLPGRGVIVAQHMRQDVILYLGRPAALERADPGGRVNEEAGAQRHLPGRQVIMAQHARQNVVHQSIMAAAHGVLYERARVCLALIVADVNLHGSRCESTSLASEKGLMQA